MIEVNEVDNTIVLRKNSLSSEELELYNCLGLKPNFNSGIVVNPKHLSKEALLFVIQMSYPDIFNNRTSKETKALYAKIKNVYDYHYNNFIKLCEERLWYFDKFYKHQKDVLFFSAHRKVHNSSMEQGLGKTIVAISDSIIHDTSLTVVITTATSKWNWFEDLTDFGKSEKENHWGFEREWFTILDSKKSIYGSDTKIILVNYDMLHKFAYEIIAKKPAHIIIDECHNIKNPKSKRTKRVIDICKTTGAKISLLSGTPSPNKTVDYYNYLNIGNHPYGKNYWRFLAEFAETIEGRYGKQIVGAKNTDKLHRSISNFMVRKVKAKCLDLPDKNYIRINFELNEYKEEYDRLFDEFLKTSKGRNFDQQKMAIHTLNKLMAKAKVKDAIELIDTILMDENIDIVDGVEVRSKKKVSIFCTYKEPIAMLATYYKGRCVVLDGTVDTGSRMAAVNCFKNDPNIDLFIGQTKAAGEALNMTFCNDCILLNFTLTRSEIDQITDRFHRIGLKKMLNVYMTVCRNSIDEALYALITRKHADTSQLIDGTPEYLEAEDTGMKQLLLELSSSKQTV